MNEKDHGQKILIVLVLLALVASIIMLVTGNVGALKLALLAALWAAALGLFLVGRYRQQAVTAREELERTREEYEDELERERAEEIDQQLQQFAEIREQLAQVQAQLEEFTGQMYVEPTMLRAEATRVRELESQLASHRFDGSEYASTSTPSPEPHHVGEPSETPGYPSKWATNPSGPISSFLLETETTQAATSQPEAPSWRTASEDRSEPAREASSPRFGRDESAHASRSEASTHGSRNEAEDREAERGQQHTGGLFGYTGADPQSTARTTSTQGLHNSDSRATSSTSFGSGFHDETTVMSSLADATSEPQRRRASGERFAADAEEAGTSKRGSHEASVGRSFSFAWDDSKRARTHHSAEDSEPSAFGSEGASTAGRRRADSTGGQQPTSEWPDDGSSRRSFHSGAFPKPSWVEGGVSQAASGQADESAGTAGRRAAAEHGEDHSQERGRRAEGASERFADREHETDREDLAPRRTPQRRRRQVEEMHGRRRQDDHFEAISVADLMKRNKK